MKTWTGQVTEIKMVPYQNVELYQFKIEQSERYFRMGRNKPEFKEGEWIEFTERNSNVDATSIWVDVKTGVEAAPSDTVSNSTTKEESTTVTSAGDVGNRLRYQAARADATRIVVAALAADHLPHSANTAKGKRLDLLTGYVEMVTKTLLEQEATNA